MKVDELVSVWCEWAEMEIRNGDYKEALKLMHRVTTPPPRKVNYHDDAENVQSRVHKSLKVYFTSLQKNPLDLLKMYFIIRFGGFMLILKRALVLLKHAKQSTIESWSLKLPLHKLS
jgi:hypothetical protein